MNEDKMWMLMTYYCPTHGDSGLVKPIQLTKKEIIKTFLKKKEGGLKIYLELSLRYSEKIFKN